MTENEKQKMQKAKAWCFDHEKTERQMVSAWNNALASENVIIKNLSSHGYEWWWLPEHLLSQLIERYGDDE